MKQYSVYFDDSRLSGDRMSVSALINEEEKTMALSQPGVLIVKEEVLTNNSNLETLFAFGAVKIIYMGNVSDDLVIDKKGLAK